MRRKIEKVSAYKRQGKLISGYKRRPKSRKRGKIRKEVKRYKIIYTKDSQGRLVKAPKYVPI